VDIRPLIGLLGVLVAAVAAEFNDQVTSIALPDLLGSFGISHDPGTWIETLYTSAEIVGMALAPWFLVTFTARRFALFVIALGCLSSILIPLGPGIEGIYALRLLQGLAGGMTIPLLMTIALMVLSPPIRLYGLAVYALTATFTPNLAATLGALWTDVVGWRFVFFEAIPLCSVAALLVWWGLPQGPPQYQRFQMFDWRGALTLIVGFGAFSTMLQQGDRLDWFNSQLICLLALISVVTIPLFFINEWFHPLPFMKLQLLGRRNIAYGALALFAFLLIGVSASVMPINYLIDMQGYRPLQAHLITLEIACAQLVLLPAVAVLLDFKWADSRIVSFVGLTLILAACVGDSFVTVSWNRNQFYLWQALQAVGQPLVVMSLLLMSTNAVRSPMEGPFVSAMINTPRALAEATAVWLLQLIFRWRGSLHSDRIVDQVGQDRFRLIQSYGVLPNQPSPLLPNGQPRAPGSLEMFKGLVEQQVAILTISDAFLIIGAIVVALMVLLLLLPERSMPPRIQLARK
jgi:DHA2 family multidrug resistance protein